MRLCRSKQGGTLVRHGSIRLRARGNSVVSFISVGLYAGLAKDDCNIVLTKSDIARSSCSGDKDKQMSDLDPDLEAWKSRAKVVWANNSPPIHENVVAAIALDLADTIVNKLAKPDTDSTIKIAS